MTTTHLSPDARGTKRQYPIDDHDHISKLPDDLLQRILSGLSTEEAVKTSVLSTRWVDLWKWRPHLVLDMRNALERTSTAHIHDVSVKLASSLTKTIKNHRGHLESCIIQHYITQGNDGTLQSWIHTATRLKHTKDLTLTTHIPDYIRPYRVACLLRLLPDSFSHHSLTSLSLCRFTLIGPKAFSNCVNLKILKLFNLSISQASVLTGVLAACPSLEVVVLDVDFLTKRGVLKIENKKLKFLQVSFPYEVDRIEVYATCLEVLDMRNIQGERDNFILVAPNIKINKNAWVGDNGTPHLFYNVSSYLAQEERSIWHELLVSEFDDKRRHGSLSVSVDVSNRKEVEILKEVLLMWATNRMIQLEIFFKNKKAHREEGERSTNDKEYINLLKYGKRITNAALRVYNVRLYNFDGSSEEEFAFASRWVTQNTVVSKVMIETSSFPPTKKLKAEAALAKLMEIPRGSKRLRIVFF